jgi:hypothetical protein
MTVPSLDRWLVGIHRRIRCVGGHRSHPVLPTPGDFPGAAGFRTDSLTSLTEAARLLAPVSHVGVGPRCIQKTGIRGSR